MNKVKVMKNLFAHGYGQIITITITILTPTILLSKWGSEEFGLWVSMSAVAQFFQMADLGAGVALANQLCMKSERTKIEALKLTRSLIISYLIKAIVFISIGLMAALSFYKYNNNEALSITFFYLAAISCLQPAQTIYYSTWRYINKNATGIFLNNTSRLMDFLFLFILIRNNQNMLTVARDLLILRLTYTVLILTHSIFILRSSLSSVERSMVDCKQEIAIIKRAGYGFSFISLSQQLNLHGPTIIISSILGPLSAAVFTACRTISRIPAQPLNVFLSSINPELTNLIAKKDTKNIRKLTRRSAVIAISISSIIAIISLTHVELLEDVWLKNKLTIDKNVLLLMCLGTGAYILSQVLNQTLTSANQTTYQAKAFVFTTITSVGLVIATLAITHRLDFAVIFLLLNDLMASIVISRKYRRFINDCTS